MKFSILKSQIPRNLREALRHAGYHSFRDQKSGQMSFIRRLSGIHYYPRYHLYVDEDKELIKFNLHLDQKKPSYHGQRAHSADYDEPLVKEEAERIKSILVVI